MKIFEGQLRELRSQDFRRISGTNLTPYFKQRHTELQGDEATTHLNRLAGTLANRAVFGVGHLYAGLVKLVEISDLTTCRSLRDSIEHAFIDTEANSDAVIKPSVVEIRTEVIALLDELIAKKAGTRSGAIKPPRPEPQNTAHVFSVSVTNTKTRVQSTNPEPSAAITSAESILPSTAESKKVAVLPTAEILNTVQLTPPSTTQIGATQVVSPLSIVGSAEALASAAEVSSQAPLDPTTNFVQLITSTSAEIFSHPTLFAFATMLAAMPQATDTTQTIYGQRTQS